MPPAMTARRLAAPLACLLAAGGLTALFPDSVVSSRHNLSAGGTGSVRATSESEVCVFCHAPHNAAPEAPLWNRYSSGALYTPYSSSTAAAAPGQPSGASKLCLSCHDGTVALGMLKSRDQEITMSPEPFLPPGPSNLGTDLSDDHPVSFSFDRQLYLQHGELTDPTLLTGAVRLDRNGQLQCTSCHDPHDDQFGKFLVMPNQASALCSSCHVPRGWSASTHKSSTATWNGLGSDPWPHTQETTVSGNGCESCHRPHGAGTRERLMTFPSSQAGCLACHDGSVASAEIGKDFVKLSAHPISLTELHDPREDLVNPPRHVECVDCHDPHEAGPGGNPAVSSTLKGVRGVSAAGSPVSEVGFEYELCFRCHGDSVDRGAPLISRQYEQTNTRQEFSLASRSHHAILGPGNNPDVPSLISPYTPASVLSCTDCHNSDSAPAAGGSGPAGPHGSLYRPILERRLVLSDGSAESSSTYALCYKCHSRTSILANSSFKHHRKHLSIPAACTTCHDPHGVENAPHLINFSTQYVTPSRSGRLEFVDNGTFRGSCYLSCHGKDHDPLSY